jgi:excisionase family DNA binding protein
MEFAMVTPQRFEPVVPSERDAQLARESSRLLAACIGQGDAARLVVMDGAQRIEVPVSALRMLVEILAQMAQGNAISFMPIHAELTTQQVADFLNVSRPHVVAMLEEGAIPYRKVGTHRRVLFKDLIEYRRRSSEAGQQAADELTRQAQELGLGY